LRAPLTGRDQAVATGNGNLAFKSRVFIADLNGQAAATVRTPLVMNTSQWKAGDSLFVFGSLMDRQVLELVSGLSAKMLSMQDATARGFRQCEVVEESYPVLVADDTEDCRGLLIGGLTPQALDRILFFEGDEYQLEPVNVVREERGMDKIEPAYYFRDTGGYSVKSESWDYDKWRSQHKRAFLTVTADYMKLYGQMTATEADAHWVALAGSAGSDSPSETVE
jgi:hypothetical protein